MTIFSILQAFRIASPAFGVAGFGLAALGWIMLSAPSPGRETQIGVIVPPWAQGGMAAAAQFNLPIITLRWGGHLVVLDISTQPAARGVLQKTGFAVITTNSPAGCMLKDAPGA